MFSLHKICVYVHEYYWPQIDVAKYGSFIPVLFMVLNICYNVHLNDGTHKCYSFHFKGIYCDMSVSGHETLFICCWEIKYCKLIATLFPAKAF